MVLARPQGLRDGGGEGIVRALRAESSNRRADQFRDWDRLGSLARREKCQNKVAGYRKLMWLVIFNAQAGALGVFTPDYDGSAGYE